MTPTPTPDTNSGETPTPRTPEVGQVWMCDSEIHLQPFLVQGIRKAGEKDFSHSPDILKSDTAWVEHGWKFGKESRPFPNLWAERPLASFGKKGGFKFVAASKEEYYASQEPRPVAPVTGMPEGCPESYDYCTADAKWHYNNAVKDKCPRCRTYEILPVGSRERLRALEAALAGLVNKLAPMMEAREFKPLSRDHACSECLAGYQPEFREMVIPGFQCAWHCARALTTGPLCLCGRALEEHTPDKDIGCTGFRPV